MTAPVIDSEALWQEIQAQISTWEDERLAPAVIKLYNGDWTLRGEVVGDFGHEFEEIENETGTASLRLPIDHYLAQWVTDHKGRTKKNVHVSFEKQGVRWTGRMDNFKIIKESRGVARLEITFKHDFEELKHIYVWTSPFLPSAIQQRMWLIFGTWKFCASVTLLMNLLRLNALNPATWAVPGNPMDVSTWTTLDMSNWPIVVAPFEVAEDNSPPAMIFSRGKSFYEAMKKGLADAQLTVRCRRWFTGDPPPWPGAVLRHGCLVVSFEDNSGWNTETSFEGNLLTGLKRAYINIASDGMTEGVDIIDNPNIPEEYYDPAFRGSLPSCPWVIFEESPYTGVSSSEFAYYEATATRFYLGGHSAPGINEGIESSIHMAGDLIAMAVGVPPVGGAAAAILKPLFIDTVGAWQDFVDVFRASELGWSHFHEKYCDGADRAYTIAALVAKRAAKWATRRRIAYTLEIEDVCPYRIGDNGHGDLYIGTRIGATVLGMPENEVYVERVTRIKYSCTPDTGPKWKAEVGHPEPEDPMQKVFQLVQQLGSDLKDLGVL